MPWACERDAPLTTGELEATDHTVVFTPRFALDPSREYVGPEHGRPGSHHIVTQLPPTLGGQPQRQRPLNELRRHDGMQLRESQS